MGKSMELGREASGFLDLVILVCYAVFMHATHTLSSEVLLCLWGQVQAAAILLPDSSCNEQEWGRPEMNHFMQCSCSTDAPAAHQSPITHPFRREEKNPNKLQIKRQAPNSNKDEVAAKQCFEKSSHFLASVSQ